MKNSSSNSSNQPSIDIGFEYAVYSIQILFGVLGMILNLTQFVMLYRSRVRHTLFEINLLSLCVADFISSLCFVGFGGFGVYELKQSTVHGESYVNVNAAWFEASSPMLFRTTIMLSFTHVIFIAFQRFFSSLFPFRFRVLFTKKMCILGIALLWTVSIGYGILRILDEGITNLTFVYTNLLCDGLLVALYSALCCILVRRSRTTAVDCSGSSRLRGDTVRKVFVYSLCVTLAFIATTSPLTVYYIFKPTIVLFIVSEAILPLNAVLNAILYFLRGRFKTRGHATRIHTFEQTLEETRF